MYSISFTYNGELVNFEKRTKKDLYTSIIDWLYDNGYKFDGTLHKLFSRKILSLDDIKTLIKSRTSYRLDHFHNISSSGNYILCNKFGTAQGFDDIFKMLDNFGISKSSLKTKGLDSEIKIKKFGEVDDVELDEPIETEIEKNEPIDKIRVFVKNPFRQSICVLGESGAGKSTTIENILENEGHNFEFIIPSASTTGLLSQFSPSKSGYVPSKLGKMIVNAYSNPTQLFTAVFDECHKSNVIEMINDELLQAISIKRNNGKRFISLDDDTAELYPGTEKSRGNILIPDNLGFIFISSNARVISGNEDFFNRVDLVELIKESRFKNIEDIIRVEDTDKKYELVSKIMSESKR
jgi:hypothetical protein